MVTKGELKALEQKIEYQWKLYLAQAMQFRWKVYLTQARELSYLDLATRARTTGRSSQPDKEQTPSVVLLGDASETAALSAALDAQGLEARTASSLEEAITLTQTGSVRLIVVDETFLNSASVCQQLREHRTIPIVLLGSSRDKEGWDRACELDADAYLGKSMSQAEQAARIKAILRRYEAF